MGALDYENESTTFLFSGADGRESLHRFTIALKKVFNPARIQCILSYGIKVSDVGCIIQAEGSCSLSTHLVIVPPVPSSLLIYTGSVSNSVRENDVSAGGLASYLNRPIAFTLGTEVRKAAYTVHNFTKE